MAGTLQTQNGDKNMIYPLCKTLYGVDRELEEIWKDNQKTYRCKDTNLHHEFCEHILNITRKDINNFSCQNCDSPINDCNCFDCFMVFCGQCNSFIELSCSDVVQMMEINEEKKV